MARRTHGRPEEELREEEEEEDDRSHQVGRHFRSLDGQSEAEDIERKADENCHCWKNAELVGGRTYDYFGLAVLRILQFHL